MSLYLTIFDADTELDGVDVGGYSDFAEFRDAVVTHLEGGRAGSRFPTLILHSDCDGEWTPEEARALEAELMSIDAELQAAPPATLNGWKIDVAKTFGIRPTSLRDCFFDVDGEPLVERLISLARLSQQRRLPILFE